MEKNIKIILMALFLVIFFLNIALAEVIISNVRFTNTNTETTVMWNTDTITTGEFSYKLEGVEKVLNDLKTQNYHELIFPTQTNKEYVYEIRSCTIVHPECAVKKGIFKTEQFFLNIDIPEVSKTTRASINGTTFPDTTIKVFVNEDEKKRITTKETKFLIYNIPLQAGENNIKIIAENKAGKDIERNAIIFVDLKPPVLTIDLSKITTQKTEELKGNANEQVNLIIITKEEKGNRSNKINKTVINDFSIPLDLYEGKNEIIIVAKDRAGYKTTIKKEITYDIGPPQFIETNLEQLTPSYKKSITIRGKVNEKSSITVFLNGKPEKTVLTDDEGKFSAGISLTTIGFKASSEEMRTMLQVGGGYDNKIKLQAVDIAGLTAETREFIVKYAICGHGSWFQSKMSDPTPEILTPRLLLEGIQQMGIAFELEHKTNKEVVLRHNAIKAKAMILNPSVEKQYDNKWINLNTITTPVRGYENERVKGYIQFNFNPMDLLLDDPEATTMDKLKELSNYRKSDCLVPGIGCMRFMLELEIPFQEVRKKQSIDPYTHEPFEEEILENQIQKICIEQEIMIDQIIPIDIIPSGFLKTTSKILGGVIDGIDLVLNPLETIGKVATIGCLAGNALLYVLKVKESLACELSAGAGLLTGDAFNPSVARSGLCEAYGDGNTKTNCQSCADASQSYESVKALIQQVCDRVACPDAPTLQTYVKRKRGRLNKINIPISEEIKKYAIGDKLYEGSDCAAWWQENKETKSKLLVSNTEVKNIYQDYLKHKSDGEKEGKIGINCAGPHPATAECCGYEYMETWGSACGISEIAFLDTFDEIKESACLSAERVGQNEIKLGDKSVECNKLWNSIAGLCEPKGGPTTETRKVIKFSDDKIEKLSLSEFSPEQMMYIFAIPLTEEEKIRIPALKESSNRYSIKLGYIVQSLEFTKSDKVDIIAETDRHYLNAKLEAVELVGKDIIDKDMNDFFTQEIIEEYYSTGEIKEKNVISFIEILCTAAGREKACIYDSEAKDLYEEFINIIGTEEKEYIVRPSSSLLRAGQCICLPGIVGNLKLWKNIAVAVKNCFDLIQISGEGSEGVCQAVLETYACELIYDGIKCFTESYSPTGSKSRFEAGGIGEFFTALSTAGNQVSTDVEERYGTTGMFKAMFVDRKLLHSVCSLAFTGTWSLDLDSLFDMSIDEVPIQSSAILYPCERRFIGYNPASYPVKGLSRWMYHFGIMVAAGSDLDLRLKLKCSQGFKCKENEGFLNGECDCKQREKELEITPSELAGTVSKYEIFSKEIFSTIQDEEASIRYDTAELIWSWTDPDGTLRQDSVSCSIKQQGTPPPTFCSFDMFTLSFRCIFGEQEGGIRFRDLTINALNQTKTEDEQNLSVFIKGDDFDAVLAISQEYPIPPKPIYTKFLAWQVIDSGGRVILEKSPEEVFLGKSILQTNGDYSISAKDLNIGKIDDDWFGAGEVVLDVKVFDTDKKKYIPTTSIMSRDITRTLSGAYYEKPAIYILELSKNTDGNVEYKLKVTDDYLKYKGKEQTGFIDSDDEIKFSEQTHPEFELEIRISDSIIISEEIRTFKLNFGEKNICKTEPEKPQKFTIKFTAYDSDKYGAPTIIPSIDPMTGQRVEIEKDFYVVCELSKKGVEIDLRSLKKSLKTAKENEHTMLTFIDEPHDLTDENEIKNIIKVLNSYLVIETKVKNNLIKSMNKYISQKSVKKLNETLVSELSKQLDSIISLLSSVYTKTRGDETSQVIQTYLNTLNSNLTKAQEIKEKLIQNINELLGVGGNECPTTQIKEDGKIYEYECKTVCRNLDEERKEYHCGGTSKKCCEQEVSQDIVTRDILTKLGFFISEIKILRDDLVRKQIVNIKNADFGRQEKNVEQLVTAVTTNINNFITDTFNPTEENLLKNKDIFDTPKKNILDFFIQELREQKDYLSTQSNRIKTEGLNNEIIMNLERTAIKLEELENLAKNIKKYFENKRDVNMFYKIHIIEKLNYLYNETNLTLIHINTFDKQKNKIIQNWQGETLSITDSLDRLKSKVSQNRQRVITDLAEYVNEIKQFIRNNPTEVKAELSGLLKIIKITKILFLENTNFQAFEMKTLREINKESYEMLLELVNNLENAHKCRRYTEQSQKEKIKSAKDTMEFTFFRFWNMINDEDQMETDKINLLDSLSNTEYEFKQSYQDFLNDENKMAGIKNFNKLITIYNYFIELHFIPFLSYSLRELLIFDEKSSLDLIKINLIEEFRMLFDITNNNADLNEIFNAEANFIVLTDEIFEEYSSELNECKDASNNIDEECMKNFVKILLKEKFDYFDKEMEITQANLES